MQIQPLGDNVPSCVPWPCLLTPKGTATGRVANWYCFEKGFTRNVFFPYSFSRIGCYEICVHSVHAVTTCAAFIFSCSTLAFSPHFKYPEIREVPASTSA